MPVGAGCLKPFGLGACMPTFSIIASNCLHDLRTVRIVQRLVTSLLIIHESVYPSIYICLCSPCLRVFKRVKAIRPGVNPALMTPALASFFSSHSAPCQNDGTCTDTSGSFLCDCAQGFTGHRCQYTDICVNDAPCPSNQTCVTTITTAEGFVCETVSTSGSVVATGTQSFS